MGVFAKLLLLLLQRGHSQNALSLRFLVGFTHLHPPLNRTSLGRRQSEPRAAVINGSIFAEKKTRLCDDIL